VPRLFTGIEIPPEVAARLADLRGGLPGARWIDPENHHLTVRFIGDVDMVQAEDVAEGLARVRRCAFTLRLTGVAALGSRRPHAIIAGVEASPMLSELHAEHERICQRVGLPPEGRRYTPHVTLARLRNSRDRDIAEYLTARGGFLAGPFTARRFVLFSSRDSIGGGPYIVEQAYPLRDDAVRPESHAAWSSP
jgi:2'-5' RNA ligase